MRSEIIKKLKQKKIICYYGACPEIYMEKAFKKSKFKLNKRLTNCKLLGETSIALDVNHTLSNKIISSNNKKINEAMNNIKKNYKII